MTNSPPTALPQACAAHTGALVGAMHSESSPHPLTPHILATQETLQECTQPFKQMRNKSNDDLRKN